MKNNIISFVIIYAEEKKIRTQEKYICVHIGMNIYMHICISICCNKFI